MARKLWLIGLVVAVLLGACGSGGEEGGDGGAAAPESASGTTVPPEDFDQEATLRVAFHVDLQTGLDPHRQSGSADIAWLGLVYDSLIGLDHEGQPEPGLAESWAFDEAGTALTFTLREGVVFQDGNELDAEAVRVNIERARTDPSPVAASLSAIETIEVVDQRTVRLHLSTPDVSLVFAFAERAGMMVSPAAIESPDLGTAPVGAGRFRLVDRRPGDRTTFERWDGYWDPDAVPVQRLEMYAMPDPATRLNALRTGAVDVVTQLDPGQIEEATQAGLTVHQGTGLQLHSIIPDRTRSEFGDPLVRQAMNYAIDREALRALDFGHADAATQWYPPGVPGHSEEAEDAYTHDPDRARELLADAGLPDGFEFEAIASESYITYAEAVQAQLAEVGIEMDLRPIPSSQIAQAYIIDQQGDAIIGPTALLPDPLTFATRAIACPDDQGTRCGESEPEWLDAVETARAAIEPEAYARAVGDLYASLVDGAAWVLLTRPARVMASTDEVLGLELTWSQQPDFRGVGLARP